MASKKLLASVLFGAAALIGANVWVDSLASQVAVAAAGESEPEIPVMDAVAREIAPSANYTGHLAAVDSVSLRPRISGYIESVHVPEGGLVERGQLLFQIDQRPLQIEVEAARARTLEAEAKLSLAIRDAERAERLFAEGAVSKAHFEQASSQLLERRAQVESARAAEDLARLNLSYTRVTAPISGKVGRILVTRGNPVTAGSAAEPLASIVSVNPLHVYFDVDEPTYLSALATEKTAGGGQVQIELANGKSVEGRLDFVSNEVDAATGTVRARAVISNPDGTLAPGLFANVRLMTGPPRPTTLIPDQAIRTDQGSRFVLVVDARGQLEYRPVTQGGLDGQMRIIESGLRPGERVVLKGLVGPGMTIRPKVIELESLVGQSVTSG
jgi:gold/copper resistance efflux system membrane fusion protein